MVYITYNVYYISNLYSKSTTQKWAIITVFWRRYNWGYILKEGSEYSSNETWL